VRERLTPQIEYVGDLARAWAGGVVGTVPPPRELDRAALARLLAVQPALQTLAPHIAADALEPAARDQLAGAAEIARRRTTVLLLELERILPVLDRAGCEPVVLKGGSLAVTAYPRPEDRWFLDLDLLVAPERVAAARDALADLGYRVANPRMAERYYRPHHFHDILVSNQGVCVEVHWALTLPASVYRHDLDALRDTSGLAPLGRATMRVPSDTDQILHGVLQSIAAGFGDLRRILDLHLLDARLTDSQRDQLAARARPVNLATALWLHYRLREEILGAPIPAAIDAACRPSPGLVRTLDQLDVDAICLGTRPRPFEGTVRLLHWLCVPRQQRLREVGRYLLPGESEWLMVGLGVDRPILPWQWGRLSAERVVTTLRMLGRLARASL
jgi:hypothetical protein